MHVADVPVAVPPSSTAASKASSASNAASKAGNRHIHTHTYIYIYTHTHIHIHMLQSPPRLKTNTKQLVNTDPRSNTASNASHAASEAGN